MVPPPSLALWPGRSPGRAPSETSSRTRGQSRPVARVPRAIAYGKGGRTDIAVPSWSGETRPSEAAENCDRVPLAILGSSPRMTKKGGGRPYAIDLPACRPVKRPRHAVPAVHRPARCLAGLRFDIMGRTLAARIIGRRGPIHRHARTRSAHPERHKAADTCRLGWPDQVRGMAECASLFRPTRLPVGVIPRGRETWNVGRKSKAPSATPHQHPARRCPRPVPHTPVLGIQSDISCFVPHNLLPPTR